MYKDDILNLIQQSPLEIDTEIQMTGRPPTMANSQFLTNKEQGDWAEQVVYKAINEFSNDYPKICVKKPRDYTRLSQDKSAKNLQQSDQDMFFT